MKYRKWWSQKDKEQPIKELHFEVIPGALTKDLCIIVTPGGEVFTNEESAE